MPSQQTAEGWAFDLLDIRPNSVHHAVYMLWDLARTEPGSVVMEVQLPEYIKEVIGKYAAWLARYHYDTYARRWAHLSCNDIEAGAMEAAVWAILNANEVCVEPFDDIADGLSKPDFRCEKEGRLFYAEATCMRVEQVAEDTGLPVRFDPSGKPRQFGLLTTRLFNEVRAKTRQCSGLEAPCLVFVGTFHWHASCVCVDPHFVQDLLTGSTGISIPFDPDLGHAVGEGYLSTSLANSAFIRWAEGSGVEHARVPISAVVVCGLGRHPPNVYGALHPEPAHVFDPELLPHLPFCRLEPGYESGSLNVSWINRKEE